MDKDVEASSSPSLDETVYLLVAYDMNVLSTKEIPRRSAWQHWERSAMGRKRTSAWVPEADLREHHPTADTLDVC